LTTIGSGNVPLVNSVLCQIESLIITLVDSILSLHIEGEVFDEIILSSRKLK
jgi:hypothetical protein